MQKYYQEYDIPASISNKNLQQIINFYLFECPVPETTFRGKVFKEFGFEGSKAFGRLKDEMLKAATDSLSNNYIPCKKSTLNESFKKIETVSPPDEYCVFLENSKKSVMQSLFSAIRNALAHGSFNVKSYDGIRIYFFVNYYGYKKAQIVLQEKTLLAWISLIQAGYSSMISR